MSELNLEREIKNLNDKIQILTAEVAQINKSLNSIEELIKLLAANSMLTNLERNFSPNVESNPTQKMENTKPAIKSARKKIPVFGMCGTNITSFCEIAKSRILSVDFVVTFNVDYPSDVAVFIINNLKLTDADKNFFISLNKNFAKILIVVDDKRNSKNSIEKGVFTKFKNSFRYQSVSWDKISVSYVDLSLARNTKMINLVELSNFPDVEKFFKNM